jgi:bacterioferritin-associated ferredoxin
MSGWSSAGYLNRSSHDMIVCVCKSVSDRRIRGAIGDGAGTFDELQLELGVALCCGKCEDHVRGMLDERDRCPASCQEKEPLVRINQGSLSVG